MNPNYLHTITVYNRVRGQDNPSKKDTWTRMVLTDCFYKNVIGKIEDGKTVRMGNVYTARIPESEKYIPYHEFAKLTEEERIITSSDNKRYPGSYPYRYANGLSSNYIINPHFTDANFQLIIYGPVVNPQVTIGSTPYLVNIVLEEGEYLIIDSRSETITKVMNKGERINAFHNRQKGRKFFQKIPPGRQLIAWTGKFDFDLIIFEERGEPRWKSQ